MSLLQACDRALGQFQAQGADHMQSPARIALRRLRAGAVPALEAVALAVGLGARVDGPDEEVERLFTGLHVVALLADLNNPEMYLGAAMQQADVSELRLERLLRARPDQVAHRVRSTARHLAAKSQPVRVKELVQLLVEQNRQFKLRIAKSYYQTAKGNS